MSTENEVEISDKTIEELQPYQNRFRTDFKVVEKGAEREVNSKNDPSEKHRLCDIKVADSTANIIFTAWDNDIDLLEQDKYFELSNGFVNIFQNSIRLSRGKFGSIKSIEDEFEANLSNNRSEETHAPRQRRFNNGGGRSSGGRRREGGYGGGYRNSNRDYDDYRSNSRGNW